MPELPDLQSFTGNLNKALGGKKVKEVSIVNAQKLKVPKETLKKSIEKSTLEKVERVGKELHLTFSNGNVLGLHLMLHGELYILNEPNNHKHKIIELVFDDSTRLVMSDYQGAAAPKLNPEESDAPDALSKDVDVKFLREALKRKTSIKNVLLDQHAIRGIGNAYADEILWDAGINPFSIANKIPGDKIKALATSIKKVLKDAIKHITKNHPDIIKGEVRDFLNIHNAKKDKSPTGAPILVKVVGGRKTYYTDEQEMYE